MPDNDPQTRNVRPTIRIEGQANAKISGLLNSMRVSESEGGMSSLEMRLDALARFTDSEAELVFEDESIVKLGSNVAIYAGEEDAPQEIFRGIVTGIEATFAHDSPPEFVVLAEDALQRARLERRTLLHDNATIAGLAQDLASAINLRPVVTGFSDSIGLQVQWNESDLAFLRRLLATRDGDLQVVGDELHVSPRKDVRRGELELELYTDLRRVRITADLAHQVNEVTVTGWSAKDGRKVSGRSSGGNAGPGTGRKGADLLQQSLSRRSEHVSELPATTDDEARAIAEAAFDRRARRFVCVDATAEGNPALRVGTNVRFKGISHRFDNTYYVVRACHRYDNARGYQTDFEAESAFLGDP